MILSGIWFVFYKHNQSNSKTPYQRMSKIGFMKERPSDRNKWWSGDSPRKSWKHRFHNHGLENGDQHCTLWVPSTVRSRNQGDGITVNKSTGSTWATMTPPPGVKSTLLHKECYDTSVIATPEQFTCKLYGQNICRKPICREKKKKLGASITHPLTTHKCQCNLITIGVHTSAQK